MAKVSADRGIALSERKRLSFDRGILAAFLIAGCASIVALKVFPSTIPTWIRIGVPIALICLYASLTIFRTRFRLRFDQAADNCYYMGFIYTLTSLGLALYQIREGTSAQEYGVGIVRDFGLALSTTVVGIILRVAMSQIREDPHDIEEATRRELTDYSRALSGQMRGAVRMLIDVREETEDRLKNFAFEMAQVVKEHQAQVGDLRDATQRLVKSVHTMAEDLASTEIPTGKLRDATAATLVAVGQLSAALDVASNALGRVDVEARNTATSHERTATASANAASEGARLSVSLAESTTASILLTKQIGELSAALARADMGTTAFAAVTQEVRTVAEALNAASRSIGGVGDRLTAGENALANQLQAAEQAAKGLAAQLDEAAAAYARLNASRASSASPGDGL